MSTPLSTSDADMYLREGDLATAADGGGMRGAGVREEKRMDIFFSSSCCSKKATTAEHLCAKLSRTNFFKTSCFLFSISYYSTVLFFPLFEYSKHCLSKSETSMFLCFL